ncbi:MAG: hypothetical protein P8100_14975 [bacterium]
MNHSKTTIALNISWALLWLVLPLSDRWTVIMLWLFGLAVVTHVITTGKLEWQYKQLRTALLFLLFLLCHILCLAFDNEITLWWKSLEKKSPLLVIPVIFLLFDQRVIPTEKRAIQGFLSGLTLSGIIMILIAGWRTIHGEGTFPWTYHELASPFTKGAIYFSWFYASAVIYLLFRPHPFLTKKISILLLIFFLVLLLLLASKLFILLTLPVALYKWFSDLPAIKNLKLYKVLVIVLAATALYPFMSRMTELSNTRLEVLRLKTFAYDTPLNGLTFRLLQYRFAVEILNQENGYLTGVGINSKQRLLDEHYDNLGIYTGNPELGDTGYLGYNFHNQYLETLVGTGIPGLIFLLLIILDIFLYRKGKLLFPLYVYFITVFFFFTESVLDRQAGIVFFCLIVFTFSDLYRTQHGGSTYGY